ncbi:hypothetical protein KC19_VG047600 [Ceratodon purpureus]|uniref:Uncharacterized protein n=1 Tax=Ceratodon purpureus TaxID=3225 RepID=A0A8T0HMB2_CERPU|nr:hypothetical protein KC19_VG047600 [Ceratodon purpureus]KAG0571844.1 hypothetical protein KC19_VG047600 [Ceratodon purpureus]
MTKQRKMKLKSSEVDYGGRDVGYWTGVMQLDNNGVPPSKTFEDKHLTLEEVIATFGPPKNSGYRCNYNLLDHDVRRRALDLYCIFYPHYEEHGILKVCNNKFPHKLYWGIVAERKKIMVNWCAFGLDVAKKKGTP